MQDNDIILEEGDNDKKIDIIENQIYVIESLINIESSPYDSFDEDRIKVIIRGLKVIYKAQQKILDEL